MNYTSYHKNILIESRDESNHPMVQEALTYIDCFEKSIVKVINDGNWEMYIDTITNYDKFLWECNHQHPQKTNPINILQNKKYSSYRETLLIPLWYRIKNRISFDTIVLTNTSVIQTMFSDAVDNFKDVDGGLGISIKVGEKNKILPIIVNEDKSGHFCKTQASNVNGIMKKFEEFNSNIIRLCTTDNKITIGKNIDSELISSISILASLRKNNLEHNVYNKLNWEIFSSLESVIVDKLNEIGDIRFGIDKYKIKDKQNKLIRESIDSSGIFINI
jgi:hypothetical protein